jgi:hypothetical protein
VTISTGLTPTFVGAKPYSPPNGKGLVFTWVDPTLYQFDVSAYSPPLNTALDFNFAGAPPAVEQQMYPAGINEFQFGTVRLQYHQNLHPEGFANFVSYADGLLYNKNKLVYAYPFTGQPITPPVPEVYNKLQFVTIGGMQSGFAGGNFAVSNYYRWMYATGDEHDQYGYPFLMLGKRYITNVYIETTLTDFGTPLVSWENRDVNPFGFSATQFGVSEVADKAHYLTITAGIPSTLHFGIPLVRDRAQTCYPFAYEATLTGHPVVDLWRKEIRPASITQWQIEGDRFGPFRSVLNRNRYMKANGFVHTVMPQGAFVLNKARPIRPYGEIHTRFGTAFAAFRIRYVNPEWYDKTAFGYDTWVRTRKIISLDGWGWRSSKVTLPTRVWSNLQTIKPWSTYPMTEMVRPWVSQGSRTLSPSAILTKPAGDPFVAYAVRQIKPAGIQHGYVGVHQLETHQNIIKVWGDYFGAAGQPTVTNKTPSIRVFGAFAFEPGVMPKVELLRRTMYAYPTGYGESIPKPFVADRTRKVRPTGLDFFRWGNGRVIFDQTQQTPAQQVIVAPSAQAGAGPMPITEWEFPDAPWTGDIVYLGYPRVYLHTIFPPSLGQVDNFGEPFLRSMVVVCEPGPSSTAVGRPSLLGGKKWIDAQPTEAPPGFGWPNVIGPQRIRLDARWDAASSTWYDYSYHTFGNSQGAWYEWRAQTGGETFGYYTTATLKNRKIYALSEASYNDHVATQFGAARLSRKPQHVRPSGVNTYKRGMPDVSHKGDKPVYVMDWVDHVFGTPKLTVQDWGPKTLTVHGFQEEWFGQSSRNLMRVELFHRTFSVPGIDAAQMYPGPRYVGPYLRVYPKSYILSSGIPQYPILDEMTTYGTPYVSYKHRQVKQIEAVDDMEPWQTSVATRLKHAPRGYFIEGTSSEVQFGMADVGNRVKYVHPSGWEEFETGFSYVPTSYPGLSKLRAQAFIATAHNAMMEFGNGTVSHA